jgi:hypothetical protein
MNRVSLTAVALAASLLLVNGCKSANKGPIVGAASPKPVSTGPASAEQVAKEMRGDVKCPAKPSVERAAGAPVDDVVGVRPGMPLDEAANFVLCDNPMLVVTENTSRGYSINTYGQHVRQGFDAKFAEARVVKSSAQIVSDMEKEAMQRSSNTYVAPLQPGQSRYFVSSMGLPGHEQVLSVSREEYFPDGKFPAMDAIKQALVSKYGEPSQASGSGSTFYLWWEYDPAGNKVPQDSPKLSQCRINASPDSGTSLSTDCGIVVGALLQGTPNNPGLARSLAVTSQNGAWGYGVLKNTEEALQKSDDARKAKELSDATKNSSAPKI